jgi:ubiquitin-conjugating enzyme E2 D/E
MAIRRIRRELKKIIDEPPIQCSANILDEDFYHWECFLIGPKGTPYEEGKFYLDIRFPLDYPFSPPKIMFKTKIYHPNINDNGNICLDILKDNWSPVLTISKIILSISSLLSDPNPDDPLVSSIAQLYRDDYDKWFSEATKYTKKWAMSHLEDAVEEGKISGDELDTKVDEVVEEPVDFSSTNTNTNTDSSDETPTPTQYPSDTSESAEEPC